MKIIFNINFHTIFGQSVYITGSIPELGNWDVSKALILSCDKFPQWSIELNVKNLKRPLEYKFLIINDSDKSVVRWEAGKNRILYPFFIGKKQSCMISGLKFDEDSSDLKCAGSVVPVFSLRSTNSFGIGDFADLKEMLNWAKLTGQKILQVLPINDTTMTHTWIDSYPYNAISIYALHPLYLSLQQMGVLKNREKVEFYAKKQQELNALSAVDYERVDQIKWAFFRDIFEQNGKKTLASKKFAGFFEKNMEWLVPYAAYSYLRDKYNTSDFSKWEQYARYNKIEIEKLSAKNTEHYNEIAIYYFLQYHLDKQLREVKDYARSNGIALKGDIPIGISKMSIEAWTEPRYFNMNFHAGAPPDDFSVNGQNWGFPTYNWEEIEKDDYIWWKKRFTKMSDYFDAYRIDHILGFFRIWEIPEKYKQGLCGTFNPAMPLSVNEIENYGFKFVKEKHANPYEGSNESLFIQDSREADRYHPHISGMNLFMYKALSDSDQYAFDRLHWDFFYQRHNNFWKEQAYKRLTPLVSCTDMLVCGEDLGMIPQSVPEVMYNLRILSLEIERMPKETYTEFANLSKLPYYSVCTTSTHDMTTIRGWWREDSKKAQRYYNQVLHRFGEAPQDCSSELCEQILQNHLYAPSMLVIIPLQDWLSIDEKVRNPDIDFERINIPVNPRYYWKYRMHLNINELIANEDLNHKIKNLIELTGRG